MRPTELFVLRLRRFLRWTFVVGAMLFASRAGALNILVVNDDGLTPHVEALYAELRARGHDVVVSTPCRGQSGMGAAVRILEPLKPLEQACLNNAAEAGDPGAGPVTRSGEPFDDERFYYVDGTPVMATAYGLDVLAQKHWQAMPDLVVSGPNQGPNLGAMVLNSGTVSNAQFALSRGVPAVAVSVGLDRSDRSKEQTQGGVSTIAARHTGLLVAALHEQAGDDALLPPNTALNVNLPADVTLGTSWAFARIGTYQPFRFRFVEDLSRDALAAGRVDEPLPGLTVAINREKPTAAQSDDEGVVAQRAIAISVMQLGYEHSAESQQWLRRQLERWEQNKRPAS